MAGGGSVASTEPASSPPRTEEGGPIRKGPSIRVNNIPVVNTPPAKATAEDVSQEKVTEPRKHAAGTEMPAGEKDVSPLQSGPAGSQTEHAPEAPQPQEKAVPLDAKAKEPTAPKGKKAARKKAQQKKKSKKGKKVKRAQKARKATSKPSAAPLQQKPAEKPEGAASQQTGARLSERQKGLDQASGLNWLKDPELAKTDATGPAATGGTRPAAKKAAAKPCNKGGSEPSAVNATAAQAGGLLEENAEAPSLSRANTSAMHTPSDLPANPPAEDTALPPKDELQDEEQGSEAGGGGREAAKSEAQTQKKRKEKTEAEKAAHARYMKFSRSLKRGLECINMFVHCV